jgi:hypothetical protein
MIAFTIWMPPKPPFERLFSLGFCVYATFAPKVVSCKLSSPCDSFQGRMDKRRPTQIDGERVLAKAVVGVTDTTGFRAEPSDPFKIQRP